MSHEVKGSSTGTFTLSIGNGTSDPLPYNATGARAYDGFLQACARNTLEPYRASSRRLRWRRRCHRLLWGIAA
jgi:hypothetical protein